MVFRMAGVGLDRPYNVRRSLETRPKKGNTEERKAPLREHQTTFESNTSQTPRCKAVLQSLLWLSLSLDVFLVALDMVCFLTADTSLHVIVTLQHAGHCSNRNTHHHSKIWIGESRRVVRLGFFFFFFSLDLGVGSCPRWPPTRGLTPS